MRISAQAKAETRSRIESAARELFAGKGLAATSTRELAEAAGIAAGTLFNYFPSKEALALSILVEALEQGLERFHLERRGAEGIEEDLFAHIAAGLRELEPHRGFVGEVIETAMSPFTQGRGTMGEGETIRIHHLETVRKILRHHRLSTPNFVTMHLYWTLYLGVLAFWAADESPQQQDTLAVLDQSVRLFVSSIVSTSNDSEEPHGFQRR